MPRVVEMERRGKLFVPKRGTTRKPASVPPRPRGFAGAPLSDDMRAEALEAMGLMGFDGTAWDRLRAITAASGTSGAGILGVVSMLFDGGNYYNANDAATTADGVDGRRFAPHMPMLFNEASRDRQRGNTQGTLLASAARAATTNSPDQTNFNARGVAVILDVTGTPNNAETITVSVQAKDPISAKYRDLTSFTALTASVLGAAPTAETYVYHVYPGAVLTVAAIKNLAQAIALPRTYRVVVTHSAGGSWTYSVAYALIV